MFNFKLKNEEKKKELISISYKKDGVALTHTSMGIGADMPEIENIAFVPCPEPDFESYASALDFLIKDNSLYEKDCNFILNSDQYDIYVTDELATKGLEQHSVLLAQIKDYLDYPAEEAVIQIAKLPITNDEPKNLVIATRNLVLQQIVDSINNSDLHLVAIDIPEFCLRNMISYSKFNNLNVGCLEINKDNSHLTLIHDKLFYISREFPIGYKYLNEDGAGSLLLDTDINNLHCDELILEIQRTIDYCTAEYGISSCSHIIISPIALPIADAIEKYINENLSQEIIRFNNKDFFNSKIEVSEEIEQHCFINIGGALRYEP